MSFISIFRIVVLSLSLLFSIVVLGLSAHWTQGSALYLGVIAFEVAALIAGSASLLILPVLLFVAATRKGAFTSRIIVEIPILTILSVLWIVTSALSVDWNGWFYPYGCSRYDANDSSWCQQSLAIEGLSLVTWIMLLIYTATLLAYTLIAQSRGNNVWYKGVNGTTFFDQSNGKADLFAGEVEVRPVATNQHYQQNLPQMAPAPTSTFTGNNPYTQGAPSSNSHSGYPQV